MFFRLFLIVNVLVSVLYSTLVHAEPPTILVFGDSLSAAYGIPKDQGWVNLMQSRLKANSYPHQVINASISGETTSGGLSRFPAILSEYKPSIVMIELGANDGLRGLPISDMQKNLEQMIQASLQMHAKVILLGMMIPPNYGQKYTQEFSNTYQLLATKYKLGLVPFFLDKVAGKPELIQDDGLHPKTIAQMMLLDNIWPSVANEIKLPAAK